MLKLHKKIILGFILGAALLVSYFYGRPILVSLYGTTDTSLPKGVILEDLSLNKELIKVVADNLNIPWEIGFLPGGDMLVTERSGTLKRLGKNVKTYRVEEVSPIGEGGLLGLAIHPNFLENSWIYLYFSTKTENGLQNQVVRYRLTEDRLMEKKVIIDDIPGAKNHDGGRMAFGPDDYLYVTTGDAGVADFAQDTSSLAGKILRVTDEGFIPSDNPFGNAVYSYGHRNPQGIAWDSKGRLWATEHGDSGFDELNLIEKGKNYGWPIIQGNETRAGMERSKVHSGRDETWAPSGAAYLDGSIFFSGLRSQSLYEAKILPNGLVSLQVHVRKDFGRIRAVVTGPDGFLYFSTSNNDGRGAPRPDDDKIYRVSPDILK